MRSAVAAAGLVCTALLCACAGGSQPAPSAAAAEPAPTWQAPLDRDHPLVGRIFDAGRDAYVGEQDLVQRMRAARFVLIGEQHDNPDHHLLQARLLRALVAGGRRPAVVFEMLNQEQQPAVDRALAAQTDVDGFGVAVDWAHSGWPPWSLYRPLFAEVIAARLPIVAAGLDRKTAMRMAGQDISEFDPALAQELEAAGPLPPAQQAALREEMQQAHCGKISAVEMLDAMVLIQRARDARLALGMQRAGADGAVLIAGAGHVRRDRGVPAYLARAGAGAALSIALLEVQPGGAQPADYVAQLDAAEPPYDLLWFTPRASDADHCAEVAPHPAPPAQ
jgi:uncharacterized iron-regulated protein